MNRKARSSCFIAFTLVVLGGSGCGSSKKQATSPPLDKIVGKAQLLIESGGATDAALNAGGENSVYIWEGRQRYRLFLKTPVEVVHGTVYVVEGVNAQKVIDEIGDPDQGKNGYPLLSSCDRVVRRAWPNLSFDAIDPTVSLVRARVKRYPARPLFLVTRIRRATPEETSAGSGEAATSAAGGEKDVPEISVPAEKQRALLIESLAVLPAPLWEPAGGTVSCPLIIDQEGKVAELETGKQLCEAVPWSKFRYKPTLRGGRPVRVSTEVEVRFEPRT